MKSSQKLNDIYLVGGLMLVGLLLRLPSLKVGLWRDEAYTYFDALPVDIGEVFRRVVYTESSPPGFFLIMHQWIQWFGAGEISLKVPALIFGLLLIPATYFLGLVVSSRRTGLVAAVITTFARQAIYFSQEARPYSITALLCCLTVLLYCQALTSKSQTGYLVGFVLCAELLLYVHYAGLLVVGSLAIITLYFWWSRAVNIRLRRFVIAFGIIFLLFTPWLQSFLIHLHTGTPFALQEVWWKRYQLVFRNVIYTLPLPLSKQLLTKEKAKLLYYFFMILGTCLILFLGIGAKQLLFKNGKLLRRWTALVNHPSLVTLGMCFLLFTIMLAALSRSGRYMFPIVPLAWVLYSSWLISLFQYLGNHWTGQKSRFARHLAIVLLLFLLVIPNSQYALALGNQDKSGIRSLAADLEGKFEPKTFYLLSPDYFASTFGYYLAKHPLEFYGFARWEHPEIFSARGYVELWNNPNLVSETEERIRNQAQKGYQQLVLIDGNATDYAQIKYGQSRELLSRLKQIYPYIKQKTYPGDPGKMESVTVYIFHLLLPGK